MRRLFFVGAAASVVFAACVGDEPATTSGDAATDGGSDSTTSDGDGSTSGDGASTTDGSTPTTCDLATKFGAPVSLDALNTTNESAYLRLSSDGFAAYYSALSADGSTSLDLYETSRTTLSADFSNPVDIDGYPSTVLSAPSITGDGLSIYYSYFPKTTTTIDLLTRPDLGHRFTGGATPVAVGGSVDSPGDGGFTAYNIEPFVREDGKELYFTSDRLGGGNTYDIYNAQSVGDGGFASANFLSELGSYHQTRAPVITTDGLTLYYASMRTTDGGAETNWSIYRASRASTSDAFGNITRVDELALDQDSFPNFITHDLCTIYFHRVDLSGAGTSLLYKATRAP